MGYGGRAVKKPLKKPCSDCPFRRIALPGWLGEDTPESFIATTMRDEPMPCHQSVDYERPDWKEDLNENPESGRYCAGALIFFANLCKLSRDPRRPKLDPDHETVFATPQEFVDYHTQDVRAWARKKRK